MLLPGFFRTTLQGEHIVSLVLPLRIAGTMHKHHVLFTRAVMFRRVIFVGERADWRLFLTIILPALGAAVFEREAQVGSFNLFNWSIGRRCSKA